MTLVDGSNLSTWEGGLFDRDNENSVSLLYRLLWIFTQLREEGVDVGLNEAGRPFGSFSDIAVGRNGQSASQTASGRSTVCYQYGRYLLYVATGGAQGTPSAANPYAGQYASKHTVGVAGDIDCDSYSRLDYWAERAGMKRTISSEIWHYEIYRNPDGDIDFSAFSKVVHAVFGRTSTAGEHTTPIQGDDMYDAAAREELIGTRIDKTIVPLLRAILAALGNDDAQVERILNAIRREARPRQYRRTKTGEIAAIDTDQGFYHSFASLAERENWMRLQMVAPENALECSEADWTLLMDEVQGKLHTLVSASSEPIDLGTLVPTDEPTPALDASAPTAEA
ncbi:hypothetical protein [Herbiconiux sp.]|uniref:hypothetical protein n=1 Tax=Herbiconiux sp. TaxID=1871186 RepID=UPI0025B8B10B|nr:hypothetical protein [Herbiconiux sp.]